MQTSPSRRKGLRSTSGTPMLRSGTGKVNPECDDERGLSPGEPQTCEEGGSFSESTHTQTGSASLRSSTTAMDRKHLGCKSGRRTCSA